MSRTRVINGSKVIPYVVYVVSMGLTFDPSIDLYQDIVHMANYTFFEST